MYISPTGDTLCEKCGQPIKLKRGPSGGWLAPFLCDPCDKMEGKRMSEFHHRNYGAPTHRSEQQKKREPF